MKRSIIALLLLGISLTSCSNYMTERSRRNTRILFRDSTSYRAELIGIHQDSLIVEEQGTYIYSSHHYKDVESVTLFNEASSGVTGGIGLALGAGVGLVVGWHIASNRGNGDLGGVGDIVISLAAGAVGGLLLGSKMADDREITIDDREDLLKLAKYCLYPSDYELTMHRRY